MLNKEPALDHPVTVWIDPLKNSDDSAAEKIWNHLVLRLYDSARNKLQPNTRAVYREEDAAQSAFHSVCVGWLPVDFQISAIATVSGNCCWSLPHVKSLVGNGIDRKAHLSSVTRYANMTDEPFRLIQNDCDPFERA